MSGMAPPLNESLCGSFSVAVAPDINNNSVGELPKPFCWSSRCGGQGSRGSVGHIRRRSPICSPMFFSFLCSQELPCSHKVHEASRLVLDRSLMTKEARRPMVDELIVAYMERGMHRTIDAYVGFMLPRIWNSTFLRAGWDIEWLGPEIALPGTTDIVRAGLMPVSERMNDKIRDATGIRTPILNYGSEAEALIPTLVSYSHLRREDNLAA
jgi:Autoinducer synthase